MIVSLFAFPRSTFPFAVRFWRVTSLGKPIFILLLDTSVLTSFVVPSNVNVSVPTITLSFDPESAAIVNVVSILSIVALTAFADTRVS